MQDQQTKLFRELELKGNILDIDFSPDRKHLAAIKEPNPFLGYRSALFVWDVGTSEEATLATAVREGATGGRFSPDNRFLAVSYDDHLELFRTTDWQFARILEKGKSFSRPRFSPLGNRLAAVKDQRQIVVWDLGDLAEPWAMFPHQSDIQRLVFSPDGRLLTARRSLPRCSSGPCRGNDWILFGGLEPGARVVVDGALRVRPGVPLKVADAAAPAAAPAAAGAARG